jgi:hypothetical protein
MTATKPAQKSIAQMAPELTGPEAKLVEAALNKRTSANPTLAFVLPEGRRWDSGAVALICTDGDSDYMFRVDGKGATLISELPHVSTPAAIERAFGLPAARPQGPPEEWSLREWESREVLSAYITAKYFRVAPRTVALWPIRWVVINKLALGNTAEAIAHAERVVDEAAKQAVKGGAQLRKGSKTLAAGSARQKSPGIRRAILSKPEPEPEGAATPAA